MNLPQEVASCAICPRLCRDVCPVAVHAGRDDLVPSEKMRAVAGLMGAAAGVADGERLMACTDCGACTEHCLLQIPVASWLDAGRERWLAHEAGALPPPPPDDPLPPAIEADQIEPGTWLLTTCGGAPDGSRERLRLAEGPREVGSPCDERPAKCDPAAGLHAIDGLLRHKAPMGSTCCGQHLHPGVGGADLRGDMARAMVAGIPNGATVLVADGACAGHLAASVGERLHIVRLDEDALKSNGGGTS